MLYHQLVTSLFLLCWLALLIVAEDTGKHVRVVKVRKVINSTEARGNIKRVKTWNGDSINGKYSAKSDGEVTEVKYSGTKAEKRRKKESVGEWKSEQGQLALPGEEERGNIGFGGRSRVASSPQDDSHNIKATPSSSHSRRIPARSSSATPSSDEYTPRNPSTKSPAVRRKPPAVKPTFVQLPASSTGAPTPRTTPKPELTTSQGRDPLGILTGLNELQVSQPLDYDVTASVHTELSKKPTTHNIRFKNNHAAIAARELQSKPLGMDNLENFPLKPIQVKRLPLPPNHKEGPSVPTNVNSVSNKNYFDRHTGKLETSISDSLKTKLPSSLKDAIESNNVIKRQKEYVHQKYSGEIQSSEAVKEKQSDYGSKELRSLENIKNKIKNKSTERDILQRKKNQDINNSRETIKTTSNIPVSNQIRNLKDISSTKSSQEPILINFDGLPVTNHKLLPTQSTTDDGLNSSKSSRPTRKSASRGRNKIKVTGEGSKIITENKENYPPTTYAPSRMRQKIKSENKHEIIMIKYKSRPTENVPQEVSSTIATRRKKPKQDDIRNPSASEFSEHQTEWEPVLNLFGSAEKEKSNSELYHIEIKKHRSSHRTEHRVESLATQQTSVETESPIGWGGGWSGKPELFVPQEADHVAQILGLNGLEHHELFAPAPTVPARPPFWAAQAPLPVLPPSTPAFLTYHVQTSHRPPPTHWHRPRPGPHFATSHQSIILGSPSRPAKPHHHFIVKHLY